MSWKLIRTAYLHRDLDGVQGRQEHIMHLGQLRRLFLSSLMTVVGLTCNTRAVSRIPLAFMATSTICSLLWRDWTGSETPSPLHERLAPLNRHLVGAFAGENMV
jgi:hypothetical protein